MTLSKFTPEGHIVALAIPMWGHIKPLAALLAKIVRLRRVHVTFFTNIPMFDKTSEEVDRQFLPSGEEHLRGLIRLVGLSCGPNPFDNSLYFSLFGNSYKGLHHGEPIAKFSDGDVIYEAIAPPKLAILDYFCYEAMKGVRSISSRDVPVYAFQHSSLAAALFIFGPEYLGGHGDLDAKIRKIQAESPDTWEDEVVEMYRRYNGQVHRIPGIPPMHNYEHSPQIMSVGVKHSDVILLIRYSHKFFDECDGIINCTAREFEPGAIDSLQGWVAPRPVFSVGSPSPLADAAEVEKVTKTEVGGGIKIFLDNALDRHGPNSVIFISFGTVFWSAEPEKIWAIFDVLIERGIPFIFSHASPVAVIPDVVSEKIKASGLGYTAKWLPQQMILQHKACGWFMSHCGHNSVMESLSAGVPLICWPFDADQPTNAANVSFALNAGYELFEVRTGHGLRPVHRLGDKAPEGTIEAVRREALEVLEKAYGGDGEERRKKAQWLSQEFARGWEAGGTSWQELSRAMNILA